MDLVLLLVVIVGAPILIVGGVQTVIWKLMGITALRIVSAIILLACAYLMLAEALTPPVYGNKSGLVGLGILAIGVLMLENLIILGFPLIRRFKSWERKVEARWAADQLNQGKN